jgi:hypothetical protein
MAKREKTIGSSYLDSPEEQERLRRRAQGRRHGQGWSAGDSRADREGVDPRARSPLDAIWDGRHR